MSFALNTFDQTLLGLAPHSRPQKWIAIDDKSQLYPLLKKYIADHLTTGESKGLVASSEGSFSVDVLPAKKGKAEEESDPAQSGNAESKSTSGDPASADSISPPLVFPRIALSIGYGRFAFKSHYGHTFYAVHQRLGDPVGSSYDGAQVMKSLVLFTDGGLEELASFLSKIVEDSEKIVEGKFPCFVWNICNERWRLESRVTARPMESVVLPKAVKDRLVQDLRKFLSPSTKLFYTRNGIPYRRSYLFYGVPGTGKTSLAQALAGCFQRSVCYLMPTNPKMTDDSLRAAMTNLPDDSIVVFEDIDSLFAKDRSNKVGASSSITFSGLLNALDGIGNNNGQIYILTTNLREQLDPALIRNGRVDLHVEFTYAVEEQMQQMWKNFYPGEETDTEAAEAMAVRFSNTVQGLLTEKGLQMTTSALQHFFVSQMDSSAEEALAQVPTIVDEILEKNAELAAEEAERQRLEKLKEKEEEKEKEKKEKEAVATHSVATANA